MDAHDVGAKVKLESEVKGHKVTLISICAEIVALSTARRHVQNDDFHRKQSYRRSTGQVAGNRLSLIHI